MACPYTQQQPMGGYGDANYASSSYSHHDAHQQQQQPNASSGYGEAAESGGDMAGVGARRMAKKQRDKQLQAEQRRREEEQRRWQYHAAQEQEAQRMAEQQQQQQQRWEYDEQRREAQRYEEQEEERRLYAEQQQRHEQEEVRRQHQWHEHDTRQRQQKEHEQWQHAQQQRELDQQWEAAEEQGMWQHRHEEDRSYNKKPAPVHHSSRFDITGSRRHQTDSQATARPQHYGRPDSSLDDVVSDGFGGLVPPPATPSAVPTDVRATIYDDDFEESERTQSHSAKSDDMWQAERHLQSRPRSGSHRSGHSSSDDADSAGRPAVRETMYEALPKATCADCGERFPFDDLVDHTCVRDACQSPLLSRGRGSLAFSRTNSPMPPSLETPPTDERSRSPFFARYDRDTDVKGDASRASLLSPALPSSSRNSPSPRMKLEQLPITGTCAIAVSSDGRESEGETERLARAERKRHIEAQRAAKQHGLKVQTAKAKAALDGPASSLPTSTASLSPLLEPLSTSLVPRLHMTDPVSSAEQHRSHRRALDSHSSTASSTASSKSSASSSFFKPTSGTLTPSSSNEQVSSTSSFVPLASQLRTKKADQGSPPRRVLDLQDLEGLVREIENAPATTATPPPPSSSSSSHYNTRPRAATAGVVKRSETLEPPSRASPRLRRPTLGSSSSSSSSSSGSRTNGPHTPHRRATDDAGHTGRKDDRGALSTASPIIGRSRTRDRATANKLCSVCLNAFRPNEPMVKRDGKVFCMDDYAELYLEKCRKCQQAVRTVGVRSHDGALSGLFHRQCFSCLQCDATFDDGTFYVFDNAPYCAHHYHTLNGTLCGACGTGIEGQCRQLTESASSGGGAGGERFHMRCLTCQFDDGKEFCKDLLHDYFVCDGKRFCEWHFERVMAQSRHGKQQQQKQQQHRGNDPRGTSSAVAAAELRSARRTTYLRTVAAKKGRA